MKVARETLCGSAIEQLRVVDAPHSDHYAGETVGYRCSECGQADESRDQIWHDDDCELAGDHGRSHYDDMKPVVDDETPEFDPDHTLFMVRSAETDSSEGVQRGNPLMWVCGECYNGDETAPEIVHDSACPLAE